MDDTNKPVGELVVGAIPNNNTSNAVGDISNLHKDVFKMVSKQLARSERLDEFLYKVEQQLFNQTTIDNLANDPEGLLKIFSRAFYYKNQADNMVVKVMELSSKNDLIKKFLASIITEQGARAIPKMLDPTEKKKVDDAVLAIKKAAVIIANDPT